MSMPEVLYTGSVKNVRGNNASPELIFEYSNRYSVFDWGAMPDELPRKGEALARMAWDFFRLLDTRAGIPHHALAPFECAPGVTNGMRVKRVQVLRPEFKNGKYDYSAYQTRPANALVPLEVIFRFGVPSGSSLLSRTSDPAYCQELGLQVPPREGDRFDLPILEFSTKLETTDRYLSLQEAQEIAGLTPQEFAQLKEVSAQAALNLKSIFAGIGVELWDGKVEFGFIPGRDPKQRDFMLVDSVGPDELRLTFEGVSLSKENLRQVYRPTSWYKAVARAKDIAKERGVKEWKEICVKELGESPAALPEQTLEGFSMIYLSLAQKISSTYFGQDVFPNAWELPRLRAFLESVGEGTKK